MRLIKILNEKKYLREDSSYISGEEVAEGICKAIYRHYNKKCSIESVDVAELSATVEECPLISINIDDLFDYNEDYEDRYDFEQDLKRLISKISADIAIPFGVSVKWGYDRKVNHGVFQGYTNSIFKDRPYVSMQFEGDPNKYYGYLFWQKGIVEGAGFGRFIEKLRRLDSVEIIKRNLLNDIIKKLDATKDYEGILNSIDEDNLENYVRNNIYRGRIPIKYPEWLDPNAVSHSYTQNRIKEERRNFFHDYLNDWLAKEIKNYIKSKT